MRHAEIGPYRVLRLIRRGGGGSVYVAIDRRLRRRVALKLIPMPRDSEQRDAVLAEARALARQNHPGVVQLFDVVETGSHLALVMEYVSGCDLEDLIPEPGLNLAETLQLAVELCVALAAVHRAGIVHRDLKAANVLLDTNGRVKLTDFGISRAVPALDPDADPEAGSVPGSYLSLSPEQAAGGGADQRTDLFALGLLLYRLLTGAHPYSLQISDPGSFLQSLIERPHPPLQGLAHVPAEMAALVDELLSKNPQSRPQSALAVRRQLMDILRDQQSLRGSPLAGLMRDRGREEDRVGDEVVVPDGLGRSPRSHIFPHSDWGRWAPSLLSAWWGKGIVLALCLCAGLGVMVAEQQWHTPGLGVSVAAPVWIGPGAGRLVEVPDLQDWATAAVAVMPGVVAAQDVAVGDPAEQLFLQVRCNTALCSLRLRRQWETGYIGDYRLLLPDAPPDAWRDSVEAAVQRLYSPEQARVNGRI